MKINGKTLAFVGALLIVPALALAQTKPAATHATNGIIKSADATSLVIAKTAKDTKTTTFTLNAATVTKGTLTPGSRVEVRYRKDGTENIATAVTATVAKVKSSPKSGK